MDYSLLLQDVRDHAGLASDDEAWTVSANVLARLGAMLAAHDRHALAVGLPAALVEALFEDDPGQDLPLDVMVQCVADRGGLPVGRALEHTHVVCQALARTLGDDRATFLRARLPDAVAELFQGDRPTMAGPGHFVHMRATATAWGGTTLASGRPGSTHPVAESAYDIGQSGSVARAPNPHGERKLSSAGGPRRSGRGSTLATGRPGSTRPISEYDEP